MLNGEHFEQSDSARTMKALDAIVASRTEDPPFEEVPYFIASQHGWFINSPTLFGIAQTKSKEPPPIMREVKPRFHLNGKKLPAFVLTQAHHLFKRIWEKQQTEACVIITYSPTRDQFRLFVPEQHVGGASVNFRVEPGAIRRGFNAVGTIHSHCNFSAFHSGTDQHDMGKMPGLHITMGHVDRDIPEMVFALSVGTQQFDTERDYIIDEEMVLDKWGRAEAPEHWDNFIKTGAAPWSGGTGWTGPTKQYSIASNAQYRSSWHDDDDWMLPRDTEDKRNGKHDKPWQTRYQMRQAQKEQAFQEFAEEIDTANEHIDALKEYLAMLGFVMYATITHDPERADEISKKAEQMMLSMGD